LIQKYAKRTRIPFVINLKSDNIAIGEYVFRRTVFQELIRYIWLGGFPRWRDEIRPDYVMEMKRKIEQSNHLLFEDIRLE